MNVAIVSGMSVVAMAAGAFAQPQFGSPVQLSIASGPDGVVMGDWNGDGDLDLAVSADAPDRVVRFGNDGTGTFAQSGVFLTGPNSGAGSLAVEDFDGDGDDDIAVALHNAGEVRIYMNTNGTFSPVLVAATGDDPRRLTTDDLDGDGDLDLMTVNRDSTDVTIMINNGTSLSTSTIDVVEEPRGIASGQLRGNASPEIFVAMVNGDIAIYENDGAGVFTPGGTISVGGGIDPEALAAADMDGDGDLDLVVSSSGGGTDAVILFRSGSGAFDTGTSFPSGGLDPDTVRLTDADNDGDLDVIVANLDSGGIAVMENDGTGALGAAITIPTGDGPNDIETGDINGDDLPDLAVTNEDDDTVTILLNQTEPNCSPADVSGSTDPTSPDYGNPDGVLDASDFFYFLDRFAEGDLASADHSGSSDPTDPSYGVPDGVVDAADFFFYLDVFVQGCVG